MATPDVQKTIDIIFNGTDKVSGVLADIDGNINSFAQGAQDVAAPFEKGTLAVLAMDAALVAMIATGVSLSSAMESESNKMANALGLPTKEAERFSQIAQDVYSAGYGDDLAYSFSAVTLAQQKFADSAETDIGRVVTAASQLDKTFGVEYTNSLSAVKTLMTNFGLSAEESFDFVAAGYQKGLDGSGDFIESINEYATQFSNGGATAEQFFSVMESGFQEGMLGTDRAADAFKEFRVRIQDGSKTTAEALDQIGLGQPFLDSLANGEITAIDAFGTIIQKLNEVEDSSVVLQAGVGLIGTQFEDLGTQAALSLDTTKTKMGDIVGTMDDFNTGTFEQKMTSAWRTAITAVSNLGIWDTLQDNVSGIAGDIAVNFQDVLTNIDTSIIEGKAEELFNIFADFFKDADLDLTTVEGMSNAANLIVESIESVIDVSKGMAEVIVPIISLTTELIKKFNELEPGTKELAGNILILGSALGTAGGILATGSALLSGLGGMASILAPSGALAAGLGAVITLLTGPVGLAVALGAATAAVIAFASGQQEADFNATIKAIEAEAAAVKELTDQVSELPTSVSTVEIFAAIEMGDFEEAQKLIDEATSEAKEMEIKTKADEQAILDYWEKVEQLPKEKQTELLALLNSGSVEEVESFWGTFTDGLEGESSIEVKATADKQSLKETTEILTYEFDGKQYEIEVPVEASGLEKIEEDINGIPTEKQIEIQMQGDIDKELAIIETSAKTVQESLKYQAEVDIAQAQEATKQLDIMFSSLNASIESSAGVYSAAFEGAESSSYQARTEALDIMRQEQEYREQSFELQKKLTETQIAYMDARTKALEDGGAEIMIDTSGLEPALEMIFIEVVKKTQVYVNEAGGTLLFP